MTPCIFFLEGLYYHRRTYTPARSGQGVVNHADEIGTIFFEQYANAIKPEPTTPAR